MYSKDFDLISNFHTCLAHSDNTVRSYNTVFNKYRHFHNMALTDLLAEAYSDQDNHVPPHRLRLTDRLNSFKNHLLKNHINNTVLSSFSKIKTFYRFHSVRSIAETKLRTNDYDLDNYLLRHDLDWLGRRCMFYNEYFGFGKSGGYVRFRPHMFRKFFATHLTANRNIVDALQGRCKSKTHNAYFKENPHFLKIEYVKCLNNISLYHTYKVQEGEVYVYSKRQ